MFLLSPIQGKSYDNLNVKSSLKLNGFLKCMGFLKIASFHESCRTWQGSSKMV